MYIFVWCTHRICFHLGRCPHSLRLHIALKMASAKKNSLSQERRDAVVFHGDEGHRKHASAHDYLDELMAQIDEETLDLNERDVDKLHVDSGRKSYSAHRSRRSMPSPVPTLAPPASPTLKSINLNRSLPGICDEVGYVQAPLSKHIW